VPSFTVLTEINRPVQVCFDLARDVEVHCRTAEFTGERAVAGRTSGLLDAGDVVTFEGRHFGIRQRLSARIVESVLPHRFVDEMVSGAFRSLRHVHEFRPSVTGGTIMSDTITWESPLGILGRLADPFVGRHLRQFVIRRNSNLKALAEGSTVRASAAT
jgi:ligand-binding SRPBCC domain-containing protein